MILKKPLEVLMKPTITGTILILLFVLLLLICSCSTKPNKVSSPIFVPSGGIYDQDQLVSIYSPTEGAEIRYTIDGSTPPTNSIIYTAPINVPLGTTIKAFAYKPGMDDSKVVTQFYSGRVPTPEITPESGIYLPGLYVRIKINGLSSASSWPAGVSVRYTLDGTEPDSTSALYSMPFVVTETLTIKTRAYRYNWTPSPIASKSYSIPPTLNIVSTTAVSGYAYGVAVSGNFAYVANRGQGLKVYDISNPAALVEVASLAIPGDITCIEVFGQHAYLAVGSGIRVISVQNPASPQLVTSIPISSTAISMAYSGNLLYAGLANGYVLAIDIHNPGTPQPIGSYLLQDYAYGLTAKDSYVYAAAGKSGMVVLDFSNSAYPELLGTCQIQGFASDVSVRGNYAYVTDYMEGLQVINISNPASPAIVGVLTTTEDCETVLAADNGFVYVYVFGDGLIKVNVSNPAQPVLAGYCLFNGIVPDIRYSNNKLYLANISAGIQVVQP